MSRPGTILCALTLMLCAFSPAAFGQEAGGTEEVVRVNAELVQTGVSVFDKQGRFVDGLKREEFELRVDGRPVPITFFENIVAGSLRDRLTRAAAAGEAAPAKAAASAPSFRQRTVVFFLDDRHLSLGSVTRTRTMLLDFIDREMDEGDLVAIASASGRIGFLQQFTDNRDVLRAAVSRLGRITNEARRAGVVIYTIDARGLISGALDATGNVPMDANGGLESANLREVVASQDALNALAADTGGRALRNQNYFDKFVGEALEETSRYYLIAWRPEANEGKNEKLRRIEVSVAGRPDLTVRAARGFVSGAATANVEGKGAAKGEKKPADVLRQALTEFYPRQALPLQLSLIYLDIPSSGTVLTTSVQAFTEGLSYGAEGREAAQLTIEGVVLDDQGRPAASFRTGLKVNPPPEEGGGRSASNVIYNHPSPLKPGLDQVRVAARDERSGVLGSASQWVVIPDLSTRQLSLSSLIVGLEGVGDKGADSGHVQWSVDKRFAHGSRLRFMTFVYNAGAVGNLSARVQVFRESREVTGTPFRKVSADAQTDPARVPYTAEINLGGLQPGRYTLRVTVEDSATHRGASQQTTFYVQ